MAFRFSVAPLDLTIQGHHANSPHHFQRCAALGSKEFPQHVVETKEATEGARYLGKHDEGQAGFMSSANDKQRYYLELEVTGHLAMGHVADVSKLKSRTLVANDLVIWGDRTTFRSRCQTYPSVHRSFLIR